MTNKAAAYSYNNKNNSLSSALWDSQPVVFPGHCVSIRPNLPRTDAAAGGKDEAGEDESWHLHSA